MIGIAKKVGGIHSKLDSLLLRNERVMFPAVRKWFDVMLKQIRGDLISKYIRKDDASEFTDWYRAGIDGMMIMKPAAMEVYVAGGNAANRIFNVPGGFDALTVDAVKQVDDICATLVREVNQETKEGIRAFIKEGIKRGKGMPQVAREMRPLVGLTKLQTKSIINYEKLLAEKHPEMSAKMRSYKTRQYASKTQTRRLNTIARTETARAQSAGYAQSMKEMGVEQLELSATTGACRTCAAMNGNKYDIDKAGAIIPVHPNCRCAMLPVVDGRTYTKPQKTKPPELEPLPEPKVPSIPSKPSDRREIAELKDGNRKLKEGSRKLKDENKKLTGKLEKLKVNNRELAGEIDETKKKIKRLEEGNRKLKTEIEGKTKEIGSLKTELAGTNKKIKALEREIKEFPTVKPKLQKPPKLKPGVKPKPTMKPEVPIKANGKKMLEKDERLIARYTGLDHMEVVQAQLGKSMPVGSMYTKAESLKIAKNVEKSLLKLPGWKGQSFRGLKFDSIKKQSAFLQKIEVGKSYQFDAFQSATKSKKVAQSFMSRQKSKQSVLLHIDGRTGRDVIRFSRNKAEEEILFMKKSKFMVSKVRGNNVYLKEIF